jgi:hypothetical protein
MQKEAERRFFRGGGVRENEKKGRMGGEEEKEG